MKYKQVYYRLTANGLNKNAANDEWYKDPNLWKRLGGGALGAILGGALGGRRNLLLGLLGGGLIGGVAGDVLSDDSYILNLLGKGKTQQSPEPDKSQITPGSNPDTPIHRYDENGKPIAADPNNKTLPAAKSQSHTGRNIGIGAGAGYAALTDKRLTSKGIGKLINSKQKIQANNAYGINAAQRDKSMRSIGRIEKADKAIRALRSTGNFTDKPVTWTANKGKELLGKSEWLTNKYNGIVNSNKFNAIKGHKLINNKFVRGGANIAKGVGRGGIYAAGGGLLGELVDRFVRR